MEQHPAKHDEKSSKKQPVGHQQPAKPATDAAPGAVRAQQKQLVAPSPAGAPTTATPSPQKSSSISLGKGRQKQPAHTPTKQVVVHFEHQVDLELNKFPFAIVWCPLPFITWFVPLIGHIGIANSHGIIYDFSDDFQVSVDNFSFGTPTKYFQLDANKLNVSSAAWDQSIQELTDYYSRTRHSLCFNNCHEYIAQVLNRVHYDQRTSWTQYDVCGMITFKSTYTSLSGFIRQWGPFSLILAGVIVFLVLALK